jgi:hypothetical protein
MAVSHRIMAMGVAMWLASFPAFMLMLVMFVVRMQVGMVHSLVRMLKFNHITSRPQHCPGYGRH